MDNSKKSESAESEKTEIVEYKRSEQAQKIIDSINIFNGCYFNDLMNKFDHNTANDQ